MKKEWWYIEGDNKVQIIIYIEDGRKSDFKTKIKPFAIYFGRDAVQYIVDEGSPEHEELFEVFGLTEKHRDRGERKPIIRRSVH